MATRERYLHPCLADDALRCLCSGTRLPLRVPARKNHLHLPLKQWSWVQQPKQLVLLWERLRELDHHGEKFSGTIDRSAVRPLGLDLHHRRRTRIGRLRVAPVGRKRKRSRSPLLQEGTKQADLVARVATLLGGKCRLTMNSVPSLSQGLPMAPKNIFS